VSAHSHCDGVCTSPKSTDGFHVAALDHIEEKSAD